IYECDRDANEGQLASDERNLRPFDLQCKTPRCPPGNPLVDRKRLAQLSLSEWTALCSAVPVVHEVRTSGWPQGSRVTSMPLVFPTRMPLRRTLPGGIPKPLIFKRVGSLRPSAIRIIVAVLPFTVGRHQAIASIDNSTSSIQPEALRDGGPGSAVVLPRLKTARAARESLP